MIAVRPLRDEDVGGLQITMNNPRLMHRRHRGQHREHEVDAGLDGESALALQAIFEGLADEKLHRHEGHAVDGAEVLHVDDVRVLERRRGLGLAEEAHHGLGVAGEVGVEDLQRDTLPQRVAERFVDRPEGAAPKEREHFIGAEAKAGAEGS